MDQPTAGHGAPDGSGATAAQTAAAETAVVAAAKQVLRRQLLDRRRARTTAERAAAAGRNADHLMAAASAATTVCGFLPLPSEPVDPVLLDRLVAAGITVLVPTVVGAAPLDWTDYSAARRISGAGVLPLAAGPAGIAQLAVPTLGPAAIAAADLVLVPALAVDRAGFRLGRGGGHYDRTLALLATLTDRRPSLIAVIGDDEVVDEVPHDRLDMPVDLLVTPRRGVRPPSDR